MFPALPHLFLVAPAPRPSSPTPRQWRLLFNVALITAETRCRAKQAMFSLGLDGVQQFGKASRKIVAARLDLRMTPGT